VKVGQFINRKIKRQKWQNNLSYDFVAKYIGNWEKVAYSEELDLDDNECNLIIVLSSKNLNRFQ
jgi:hypothetical protein